MTALLTDNLPLLAGAPNGIKKLRELILELAVRGKLVPQDPNDEPASELLKRIAKEKARLVAEGKIKKQKDLGDVPEPVMTFPLPPGWVATSIGEVTICRDGERIPVSQAEREGREKVFDYYGASGVIDKIDGYLFDKPLLLVGEDGANLVNRSTPIAFMARGRYWVNNHAHVLDGVSEKLLLYIELYFNAIDLKPYVTGTAQPKMNQAKMNGIPVALPPEAEQHRIVAKVDELMALCDRLEAQQANAESAHARLVQALLDSLTQASVLTARDGGNAGNAGAISGQDFAANWQRLAEHFHTLFTTEPSIDALKQTMLQLAVMGKLVPQDLNDEAASRWIGRIENEKARLIEAGLLKKTKNVLEADTSEGTPELPDSWRWVALTAITLGMDSGWSPACEITPSPSDNVWGVLKTTAVQALQYLQEENKELPAHLQPRPEAEVQVGDILFTRAGPTNRVGISCLVQSTRPKLMISDKIIRFHPVEAGAYGRYIALCLNTGETARYLEKAKSGMAASQVNISQEKLRLAPIPLAPLPEQHRIVAKVDQLMTLCDQLKTRLNQARQLNEQLASTLVERALVEDNKQTPTTASRETGRSLLAAEIAHQLHGQRTFGQRKLQKVIYLAEHSAKLSAIRGEYLRNVAGPHDRQLMNQVEAELQNHQWYERIERETVGHAYRPLSQAGQHRQAYESTWSAAERATIGQVIELMRDWDTDRCEKTVTLYAAWNDFIVEGRPVTDEAIVAEVMHRWNDTKLRFSKAEWLAVLAEMKKHEALIPTGFGNRTTGGMLTLPGFE